MGTVELGATAGPQALLERASQLASLHHAMAEAAGGRGRLVLVFGEAGVGKTALVRHFCAETGGPIHALWGACGVSFEQTRDAGVTLCRRSDFGGCVLGL